jgi:SAM-dependent methyltransferase
LGGALTISEPPYAQKKTPDQRIARRDGTPRHHVNQLPQIQGHPVIAFTPVCPWVTSNEMQMTAAPPVAEKIRTRYRAERQRFSEAQYVLRPPDRLRVQAEALAGYLSQGDSVLDVGCGTGYLSAHLQEMYGVRPSAVDVIDFREAQIPFRQFDGTSIPFLDKSFDHVVLSEVLHHSHDPMALVKECCRVARRSIILFEDMPDGLLGKLILYLHVRIFARRYHYPFKAASISDYRSALVWLCDSAPCVARIPQEPEWFTVYPRILCVHAVPDSAAVTPELPRWSTRA